MLGRFKPVAFDPYARQRRRRGLLPPWLTLLLIGLAIGVAGVLWAQERYLPPRLSAAESTQLQESLRSTESERQRLQRELADTSKRLETALAERKASVEQLAAGTKTIEGLRTDLASLVAALPPDPRGGPVEVRAARFEASGNALAYDIVLTRAQAGNKPLAAVMQFTLAGEAARPGATPPAVTLDAIAITIDRYEGLRGSVPLPAGFRPRQATIQVLDRAGGSRLGMRIMAVR